VFLFGSRLHGQRPLGIKPQGDHCGTGRAEPEKFSVPRSSLECIEISRIEDFELNTAIRIDTSIDHASPLQQLYDVAPKQSCDGDHLAASIAAQR
jgi:hypothetical protein